MNLYNILLTFSLCFPRIFFSKGTQYVWSNIGKASLIHYTLKMLASCYDRWSCLFANSSFQHVICSGDLYFQVLQKRDIHYSKKWHEDFFFQMKGVDYKRNSQKSSLTFILSLRNKRNLYERAESETSSIQNPKKAYWIAPWCENHVSQGCIP